MEADTGKQAGSIKGVIDSMTPRRSTAGKMGEMFPQVEVITGPGEDEHKKAAPKGGLLKWPYWVFSLPCPCNLSWNERERLIGAI